ncbi:hypothetical protein [Rodentibacter haemolyticus]|uniref:Uncharacterized protein n=1 Tax=Rodentibacter haemolyticus TaxID=2778911 RepID=A0ABX6UXL5_9PAST|nr:hypothetical protein [Rodentibacter haemolyticus]QPB42015.1 hypothetical protein IHV77_08810 [Rodentibacter haemolyticus]
MSNETTTTILGVPLVVVWTIAPLYAAYKDFQHGNFFLALIDYTFFPIGLIRSLMFAFG